MRNFLVVTRAEIEGPSRNPEANGVVEFYERSKINLAWPSQQQQSTSRLKKRDECKSVFNLEAVYNRANQTRLVWRQYVSTGRT
jgi:hypothetical protein